VTDSVKELVAKGLEKAGITVSSSGTLTHDVIDSKGLIDTHYGAIASKAAVLKPAEQNVSDKAKAQFKDMFGMTWEEAVEAGKIFNAKDACEQLKVSGQELDSMWATLNRGENLLKLGGGHYVGKVNDDTYVINGFYSAMRDKYCSEPAQIYYMVVEWDPKSLSWEDFRGKVLGATDPKEAEEGSLRRQIFEQWKDLGLSAEPDVGDNSVHASASPFEAFCERVNWTGAKSAEDLFGRAALQLGVPEKTLAEWMADAQVVVDGKKQSIFDYLEDQNSEENLRRLAKVLSENN